MLTHTHLLEGAAFHKGGITGKGGEERTRTVTE